MREATSSCSWHGDVTRFVADLHRLPFDETLEQLKAGIEVGR
jgi:DNA primase